MSCCFICIETRGLRETQLIESMQDQAQNMLAQHVSKYSPNRFGKLLLVLPMLKNIDTSTTERVYFSQTVGNSSIDKLLVDLLKC